jgi:hypothetical protein
MSYAALSRQFPLLRDSSFHITGTVNNCKYLDVVMRSHDSINDSVIPEDDLPEADIIEFWHNTAATRHAFKFSGCVHQPLYLPAGI